MDGKVNMILANVFVTILSLAAAGMVGYSIWKLVSFFRLRKKMNASRV